MKKGEQVAGLSVEANRMEEGSIIHIDYDDPGFFWMVCSLRMVLRFGYLQ